MNNKDTDTNEEVPVINVDRDLINADWTKRTWDLPPVDSPEFQRILARSGKTLEEFMKNPVGSLPRSIRLKSDDDALMVKSGHDVSGEPRDKYGEWAKVGERSLNDKFAVGDRLQFDNDALPGRWWVVTKVAGHIVSIQPGDAMGKVYPDGEAVTWVNQELNQRIRDNEITYMEKNSPKADDISDPQVGDVMQTATDKKYGIYSQVISVSPSKGITYAEFNPLLGEVSDSSDMRETIPLDKWRAWVKDGTITVKRPAKKEVWQQTIDEYMDTHPPYMLSKHRQAVFDALMDKKDVPQAVLADYPGIVQEARHAGYDQRVIHEPQEGDLVRSSAPTAIDYGRIFKVLKIQRKGNSDKITFAPVDADGNVDGLPVQTNTGEWVQAFMGAYSGSITNAPLRPYIEGDNPLPESQYGLDIYDTSNNFYRKLLASVYKERVANRLAKALVKDPTFVDYAKRRQREHDELMVQRTNWYSEKEIAKIRERLEHPEYTEKAIHEMVKTEAFQLVSSWAETSADTSSVSLNIQRATAEEFNMHNVRQPWNDVALGDDGKTVAEDYIRYGAAYRSFVRQEYNMTQRLLQKRGIKSILLYRGFLPKGEAQSAWLKQVKQDGQAHAEIRMQPLSSFSTARPIADMFAHRDRSDGVVMRVQVPIEQVLSTPMTGAGCLKEQEFVVLGNGNLLADIFPAKKGGALYYRPGEEESDEAALDFWKNGQETADQEFGKSFGPLQAKPIDVDRILTNADWTKMAWDLPDPQSLEFAWLMHIQGTTRKKFSRLPVAQAWKQQQRAAVVMKSFNSSEPRDKHGRWTEDGARLLTVSEAAQEKLNNEQRIRKIHYSYAPNINRLLGDSRQYPLPRSEFLAKYHALAPAARQAVDVLTDEERQKIQPYLASSAWDRAGATLTGIHFSPHTLSETDPAFQFSGQAGSERRRYMLAADPHAGFTPDYVPYTSFYLDDPYSPIENRFLTDIAHVTEPIAKETIWDSRQGSFPYRILKEWGYQGVYLPEGNRLHMFRPVKVHPLGHIHIAGGSKTKTLITGDLVRDIAH